MTNRKSVTTFARMGGIARAAKLSPERRREIAIKASMEAKRLREEKKNAEK